VGGFWKAWKIPYLEVEDITKKVKGIATCEFPKEKSEFGTQTNSNSL